LAANFSGSCWQRTLEEGVCANFHLVSFVLLFLKGQPQSKWLPFSRFWFLIPAKAEAMAFLGLAKCEAAARIQIPGGFPLKRPSGTHLATLRQS
jgi:hypothetical protein